MSTKVIVYSIESDDYPHCSPRDDHENLGTMYTWDRNYTLGGNTDENNQGQVESTEQWVWDVFEPTLEGFEGYYVENDMAYKHSTKAEEEMLDELKMVENTEDPMYDHLNSRVESNELPEELQTKFYDALQGWQKENVAILDLYLYDHSGITIRTTPFSCRWDSGCVGLIYLTKEKCIAEGVEWEKAEEYLKGEVNTLDQYFTGDVWGYRSFEFTLEDDDIDQDDYDDLYRKVSILHTEEGLDIYLLDNETVSDWLEEHEVDDSCWGFYGHEYIQQEVKGMAEHSANWFRKQKADEAEKRRRTYWCM